jgi:hypothetical protein
MKTYSNYDLYDYIPISYIRKKNKITNRLKNNIFDLIVCVYNIKIHFSNQTIYLISLYI